MVNKFLYNVGHEIGNAVIQAHIEDGNQYVCKCKICGITYSLEKDMVEFNKIASHHCETVIRRLFPHFYRIWSDMRRRMRDTNCKDYPKYGSTGMGFQYDSLVDFFVDFIKLYLEHVEIYGEENTTIDRIKNGKTGYVKHNMRFATKQEQVINRDCTKRLIALASDGKVCLAIGAKTFAREHGLNESVVFDYISGKGSGQGWKFIIIDDEVYNEFNSFHHSILAQLYERDIRKLQVIAEYEDVSVDADNVREQIANCALKKKVYYKYAAFIW